MIFIGDIHGNFNRLIFRINRFGLSNQNLIQVGDFGIGFRSEKDDMAFMQRLNDCLKKGNNTLFVIRGNHDDPRFFDGSIKLSNLWLLPDYSVLSIESKTLLLIGGAISIDRTDRKIDLNYWEKEVFDFNESKLQSILFSNKRIDIVVTHTAPTFAFPQNLDPIVLEFTKADSALLEDLTRERERLDSLHSTIIKSTKPAFWVYGHFHKSNTHSVDGIEFHLLDENEMKEIASLC